MIEQAKSRWGRLLTRLLPGLDAGACNLYLVCQDREPNCDGSPFKSNRYACRQCVGGNSSCELDGCCL